MESKREFSLRQKTFSNLLWRFMERMGAQLVAFVVSLILARILSPEHYGLIALVTVITSILNVFVDSGLGTALIQKKNADDTDFSTVFYANIFICIILYIVLFFTAPLIAHFFKKLELVSVIRVLGISVIISGVKNVQQAYVSKHLMFKKFFFATIGGAIVSAIVGIVLAVRGFGVWALVLQQLISAFIDTCILWLIVPWRPKRLFSLSRLKSLYSFGWKLLVASLINTIYLDIRQIVIGRGYSSSDLAYYNQGQKFPQLIGINVNSTIDSVLFPVMTEVQQDVLKIKMMTRRAIKTASYIMWPLLLGLAGVSHNVVTLILTDKWLPCVPYLILACFCFGFEPLQTANLNAIKALGRSDITLKLEIVKKSISTIIIFLTMPFGVLAIAIGSFIYTIIATVCNSFPNRKLLNYSYFEQIKDIFPSFFISICMSVLVYFLPLSTLPTTVQLILQILIGAIFYVSITALLRFESFIFLKNILKKYVRRCQK